MSPKDKFVLIVGHGDFPNGLLNGAETIVGKKENVQTVALKVGDDIKALKSRVENIVREKQKEDMDVIIAVDLFGGSPSNIALSLMKDYDVKVIIGINMTSLIELLSSIDMYETDDLLKHVYEVGDGFKVFGKNSNFMEKGEGTRCGK